MENIFFVGDIHGKADRITPAIDRLIGRYDVHHVILLGDMVDDWNLTAREQTDKFKNLCDWIGRTRAEHADVTVLLGNHDLTYWTAENSPQARTLRAICPGYTRRAHHTIHPLLRSLNPQAAYGLRLPDGRSILATHAGVTRRWWESMGLSQPKDSVEAADMLDRLFRQHFMPFGTMVGSARGGWDKTISPSPLWADLTELAADPLRVDGMVQIVGHTPVPSVTRSRGGKLWFCDTFSTMSDGTPLGDGSLLLLADGGLKKVQA